MLITTAIAIVIDQSKLRLIVQSSWSNFDFIKWFEVNLLREFLRSRFKSTIVIIFIWSTINAITVRNSLKKVDYVIFPWFNLYSSLLSFVLNLHSKKQHDVNDDFCVACRIEYVGFICDPDKGRTWIDWINSKYFGEASFTSFDSN